MSAGRSGDGGDLRTLNAALEGATELLHFDLRQTGGRYDLALTLGEDAKPLLEIRFGNVQNLELNPAGNGFHRLLRLVVEDLAEDGLAGIRYGVEELERETLFLHSESVSYTRL